MTISIDKNDIDVIQFGVCSKKGGTDSHGLIPVDESVQDTLIEMVNATFMIWDSTADKPEYYNPAEKYTPQERLFAEIDENVAPLKELFESVNLPIDVGFLDDPSEIDYYFVFIFFKSNDKLLAVRRASSFKGTAKRQNFLTRMIDDSLQIIPDTVFKFDVDFDFIVYKDQVYILRPKAFEAMACIDDILQASSARNVTNLQAEISFLDLSPIAKYISSHKRSARLVASILSRDDLGRTSIECMKHECALDKVEIMETDGKMCPKAGFEESFLKVLDRRLLHVSLIPDKIETYDAARRKEAD